MDFNSVEAGLRKSLAKEGFEIDRTIFGALQIAQGDYNILRIYQRIDGDCYVHLADGTERDLPQPTLDNAEKEIYSETERLTTHVIQDLVTRVGGVLVEQSKLGSRLFRFRLAGETLSVFFELSQVRIRSTKPESTASICGTLTAMEKMLPKFLKMFVLSLKTGFKDEVEL